MYWAVFIPCPTFLFVESLIIPLCDTTMTFLSAEDVIVIFSLGALWRGSETRGHCIGNTEKVKAIWHYWISVLNTEMLKECRIILINDSIVQLPNLRARSRVCAHTHMNKVFERIIIFISIFCNRNN